MLQIQVDFDPLLKFGQRLQHAKRTFPAQMARIVQEIGPEATAQMKRVLPEQTGLKFKTINKALKGRAQGARYEIASKGGDIRLKFFAPRETSKGVSAAPWNARRVYPGTFINAGWWPNRTKPVRGANNVWRREGKAKYPIKAVRSGLFIPEEMVTGKSAVVFYGTVNARLGPAVEKLLFASIG
jgi:hypothetical protein